MKCQTGWDTTPGLGWEPVLKQGPSLLASELTLDFSLQIYKGSGPILLLLDWLNKSKPDQEVFTHNPKAREEDSSKQSSGRSSSFPSPPCAWWSFSQCPCCVCFLTLTKACLQLLSLSAPVCCAQGFSAATCCPWNGFLPFQSLTGKAKEPNQDL